MPHKQKYIHLHKHGSTPQAYRVNDYEFELLDEIRRYERIDTQAETLRFILREAACKRNLHPLTTATL